MSVDILGDKWLPSKTHPSILSYADRLDRDSKVAELINV